MTNEIDALLSEILRAENAYELLSPNIENEMRGAEGRESEEIEKQWTLIGNALFSARSHLAGLKAGTDGRREAAFEAWLKTRAISTDKSQDSWGREMYAHSHVQAMWEAWQAALQSPAQGITAAQSSGNGKGKYTKRPVTIEAFRYNIDSRPDWFTDRVTDKSVIPYDDRCWINTLEGPIWAQKGDWIIRRDVTSPAQGITAEEAREILLSLKQALAEDSASRYADFVRKSYSTIRRALQSFVPEPEILSINNQEGD